MRFDNCGWHTRLRVPAEVAHAVRVEVERAAVVVAVGDVNAKKHRRLERSALALVGLRAFPSALFVTVSPARNSATVSWSIAASSSSPSSHDSNRRTWRRTWAIVWSL